jgi:hypothetical protein
MEWYMDETYQAPGDVIVPRFGVGEGGNTFAFFFYVMQVTEVSIPAELISSMEAKRSELIERLSDADDQVSG